MSERTTNKVNCIDQGVISCSHRRRAWLMRRDMFCSSRKTINGRFVFPMRPQEVQYGQSKLSPVLFTENVFLCCMNSIALCYQLLWVGQWARGSTCSWENASGQVLFFSRTSAPYLPQGSRFLVPRKQGRGKQNLLLKSFFGKAKSNKLVTSGLSSFSLDPQVSTTTAPTIRVRQGGYKL